MDGFGLPESNEIVYFQFQEVTVMICLSRLVCYSFTMLNGLSEQKDDLIGSPRELYEEGVVKPLVFTIIPPSQRAWWAQLDNASTLGGCFGRFTFPKAD